MKLAFFLIVMIAPLLPLPAMSQGDLTLPHLGRWGSKGSQDSQFRSPMGIALDREGNVYVADQGNRRIQKFSSTGHFITRWVVTKDSTSSLSHPTGVAVSDEGEVFVTDQGNHQVLVFDTFGTFLRAWGSEGSAEGQFQNPTDIAISSRGVIYVADSGNSRVAVFSTTGELMDVWGPKLDFGRSFSMPMGLCTGVSGNVYVIDSDSDMLFRFTEEGEITATWNLRKAQALKLVDATDVAVVTYGAIALLDAGKDGGFLSSPKPARLIIMNFSAELLKELGDPGAGTIQFKRPSSVATDRKGHLYVAEAGSNRIQAFGLPTTFLAAGGRLEEPEREVVIGDRVFGLTAGFGNSFGGVGLLPELYIANTRISLIAGVGALFDPNRTTDAKAEVALSAGIRGFTSGVRHRGYLEFSVEPLKYGDTSPTYGPALSAGYHYVARGGFTILADIGVGFDLSSEELVPSSNLGLGYTWRN